ncbi:MAG: DUF503 domain-containing protein [Phycisphaeraceae bacterium]|nr:DUF503 domain-containing protein [Phycisphaeraceae bacterium]
MVVGILQVELAMAWSTSLKDKRRVVLSLKDRLARELRVSVAEVATQDDPRLATLGVALAASSVPTAQGVLDAVLRMITSHNDCVLRDHAMEILTGQGSPSPSPQTADRAWK